LIDAGVFNLSLILRQLLRAGTPREWRTRSLTEDGRLWIRVLAAHVPDHYGHAMRRFGLLAPRTQRATSAALFLLLG